VGSGSENQERAIDWMLEVCVRARRALRAVCGEEGT
jgi:hypothetical protein